MLYFFYRSCIVSKLERDTGIIYAYLHKYKKRLRFGVLIHNVSLSLNLDKLFHLTYTCIPTCLKSHAKLAGMGGPGDKATCASWSCTPHALTCAVRYYSSWRWRHCWVRRPDPGRHGVASSAPRGCSRPSASSESLTGWLPSMRYWWFLLCQHSGTAWHG